MEKVTPGPIGIGTRFSARARMPASLKIGERIFEGTEEIVDFEPNHRLISRTSSGLNSNLDVKTFDAVPNGTLVTHRFDFVHSYPSAVIGTTLLFGPNADRVQRANRADSWARAKQILESDGQATP